MHCSLSAFVVGFHVHEKALLVPAVVSALLALDSKAGARMHLRLSFLAAFAVLPLLPGPELMALKVCSLGVSTLVSETRSIHCVQKPESQAPSRPTNQASKTGILFLVVSLSRFAPSGRKWPHFFSIKRATCPPTEH